MDSQLIIFASLVAITVGVIGMLKETIAPLLKRQKARKFSLLESKSDNRIDRYLDKLSRMLPSVVSNNKDENRSKFYAAGIYNSRLADAYMPIKLVILVGGVLAQLLVLSDLTLLNQVTAGALWVIVVVIVPETILDRRAKALQQKISEQLPYVIDLMSVCVQTGMTIESSMGHLAKEMKGFDRDVSQLLTKVNSRSRVIGLPRALDEIYEDVPTSEVRSFVMTLKQSLQYGSSISDMLDNLSSDIREVRMLNLEEKIGKLSAKMSVPLILFILMPVVILVAAPGVMRIVLGV
ncbi:type II secretion system F family protein [Vibrio paucivorans]